MKVLMALRLTRTFGPLIRMIGYMIKDILLFLVLYVIQLLTFSSVFKIFFAEEENFSTLY